MTSLKESVTEMLVRMLHAAPIPQRLNPPGTQMLEKWADEYIKELVECVQEKYPLSKGGGVLREVVKFLKGETTT